MVFKAKFLRRKNGVTRIRRDSYSNGGTEWETISKEVFIRDGYKCVKCNISKVDANALGRQLQCHHVLPLSRGGRTIKSNMQSECSKCHSEEPGHSHMKRSRK